MGQHIEQTNVGSDAHAEFRIGLRKETSRLRQWFDEDRFETSPGFSVGLELEAWLVDENCLPAPHSEEFISTANDPRVVPELSKFNFELNADPARLKKNCFSDIHEDLSLVWRRCQRAAETLRLNPVTIGILPTIRDEMLQPEWMSASARYKLLNQELFRARASEPLHICIEGEDRLDYRCEHLMLEAACTSLQTHLRINQQDAARYYNAATIAAGPLVAASANSPFLYGKSLWAETRIAAFEEATRMLGFIDPSGRNALRVTLGTGYVRRSLLELFLENLSYPPLLAIDMGEDANLGRVRLHNGTIWRWNRPIIGFGENGEPHLRIEHRAMAAGPTLVDMVANLALSFGTTLALGQADRLPEETISFEDARANFYACAKDGLDARICWNGQTESVRTVLLEYLLPAARQALVDEGVESADLSYFVDEILTERIESGQNGSVWQRRYYQRCHRNFQALTERYLRLQSEGVAVHRWPV